MTTTTHRPEDPATELEALGNLERETRERLADIDACLDQHRAELAGLLVDEKLGTATQAAVTEAQQLVTGLEQERSVATAMLTALGPRKQAATAQIEAAERARLEAELEQHEVSALQQRQTVQASIDRLAGQVEALLRAEKAVYGARLALGKGGGWHAKQAIYSYLATRLYCLRPYLSSVRGPSRLPLAPDTNLEEEI